MPSNQQSKQVTQEQREQLIHALRGATKAIASAVEDESITPTEIECLLNVLVNQVQVSLL